MIDENQNGKSPIYDLYYKHKYLTNEEKYKNHKLTMNVRLDNLKPGKMILSIYMVNKEIGEDILIESVDLPIEDTEIEEDTRPRFNSPGYGRVEK